VDSDRREILISGFGGQGVVMAGKLLGRAAVLQGLEAAMLVSHGTESRGGYVRSQVVASKEAVDSPIVENPDIFCALSQAAYNRFIHLMKGGIVLYDPVFVTQDDSFTGRGLPIPAMAIAEEAGSGLFMNIVMLGAILRRLSFISLEHAERSVEEMIPRSAAENLRALRLGYDHAAQRAIQ
jgi:2-oxoglutarate ferredoxin oxidoreductase subunit gamma